jgi:hypothetical protein
MSLVKKPTMPEKKIAANRGNGGPSHGPVTAEGNRSHSTQRAADAENAGFLLSESSASHQLLLKLKRHELRMESLAKRAGK